MCPCVFLSIKPVILYSTPSNLPIPNSTPSSLHYFPYMTIFPTPSVSIKFLAFAFFIYLPPLILLTTPTCFIVYLPGLAFPLFHYNGSLHISHPAHQPSLHTFLLHPVLPAAFSKAPCSAQCFSICIPLLARLLVLLLSLIFYMLTIHNSSHPIFLKCVICHNQPSVHSHPHLVLDVF